MNQYDDDCDEEQEFDEELEEALSEIGDAFGNFDETIVQGLPDGCNSEWGYDRQLVLDLAEAVKKWKERVEE